MFWLKKSIEAIKTKKKISDLYSVSSTEQTFEVGITVVELKFKDGRKLNTRIYGRASQQLNNLALRGYEQDHTSGIPYAGEPEIITSEKQAQEFIRQIGSGHTTTYVDDDLSPTVSIVGEIIQGKIVKTLSETHTIAQFVWKVSKNEA